MQNKFRFRTGALLSAVIVGAPWMTGCVTPLQRQTSQNLREALLATYQAQTTADGGDAAVALTEEPSELEQSLQRVLDRLREEGALGADDRDVAETLRDADAMSGAQAYQDRTPDFGQDLVGREESLTVQIDLDSAIHRAMANNLDARIARLNPRIGESQFTQAESDFDTVVFTNLSWQKNDTPQPSGVVPGLSGNSQSETFQLQTGIRQTFENGTQLTVQGQVQRSEQTPSVFGVASFYDADVLFQITQPLMRGLGSEVNRAGIEIARVAQRQDVEQFRSTLIDLTVAVEQNYWQLATARQLLLIQENLLDRTITMRDKLEPRVGFDFLQSDLNEVNARIDQRRADVLRARRSVRQISDQLKRLLNDPDLPVTSETLIIPADIPADSAISFSLLDQVTTALRERPEMEIALLQIDDVELRRLVADNNRLPILNLTASVNYNGQDIDQGAESLNNTGDLDFIDYALGLQFERPWGNRDAQSLYDQRTFERTQALDNYRRQGQIVTVEVKTALRDVDTNYRLIGISRSQRRASALSLEVADVQLEQGGRNEGETFTTRVDRVLARQDALAQAELAEVQALNDYMIAISELNRATGLTLNRAGIDFDAEATRE